jgi:glycine/D-amino acid oxidase-like deaminating enzyme
MTSKANAILIVGSGLAGSCLALELVSRGIEVMVIDNQFQQSSSRVAAGLLNPIAPKGVRKTWQCDVLFPGVFEYYQKWETLLNGQFIQPYPFLNIHANKSEYQEWQAKAANPEMLGWLEETHPTEHPNLPRNWATWVNHCGRLDVPHFLLLTQRYLEPRGAFRAENFDYSHCVKIGEYWQYHDCLYQHVVFCEGIGLLQNPWFSHLYMDPTGGDILKVRIPNLSGSPIIIKQKQWIVPTREKDIYLVGSNFHKGNLSHTPEKQDAEFLLERAGSITQQPVTLIEHQRAVRPTVQQRRPYLGEHATEKGLFVFNGLGAKGSSLCSWLSPMLCDRILNRIPLHPEVDISRFSQ